MEQVEDGLNHVRVLSEEIGKRPTGFAGEARAAAYLCEQLSGWGLKDVGTEPFSTCSWDFDRCELRCETLGSLPALPVEFSASTPAGGVRGELVVFEHPGDVGGDIKGRIVLVAGGIPTAARLLDGGAAGLILASSEKNWAWHEIYGSGQPLAGVLPMLTLGYGDAVELIRHGVQEVELEISTTIADVTGHNVVATLPGSGDSPHRLNVSGHYASVPASGGASDNAAGTACAMEVIHALSLSPPELTTDLVIFSAEEIGLYGACDYADTRAAQLENTRLGIYFDGQGDFLGRNNIHVMGQQGLADWVSAAAAEMEYRADVQFHFTGLDQVFLSARGVPTLWFQRSPQLTWHTRHDIVDDVSPTAMRASIAAAVELLRRAAANPNAFPGGIDAAQQQQIHDYVANGAPVW